MKRQERLEKHGWKIVFHINGGCHAEKNNGLRKITGSSVTDLYNKIFGY